MQKQDNDQWRPVAYASRAMSPTEQRYAQIEKEALGITWASERFADYLIGLKFHIVSLVFLVFLSVIARFQES